MSNALIVRKVIERLAKEVHDWDVKSSNMHPSDADSYLGNYALARVFRKDEVFDADGNLKDIPENEYDPKTGKLIKNDEIGDFPAYLQQWDADNIGYVEEEDVKRDNGIGYQMNAMDQITPIK